MFSQKRTKRILLCERYAQRTLCGNTIVCRDIIRQARNTDFLLGIDRQSESESKYSDIITYIYI